MANSDQLDFYCMVAVMCRTLVSGDNPVLKPPIDVLYGVPSKPVFISF